MSGTLWEFLCRSVWAMEPRVYARLREVLDRHLDGLKVDPALVERIVAERDERREPRAQVRSGATRKEGSRLKVTREGVGVIDLEGVIARHARQVNGMSQPAGTSVEALRVQLDEALRDDDVRAILLDVDSPGGTVTGVPDFAAELAQAREQKPVVALADGMMASAAFWIGSQADHLVASPGAMVGSIGVFAFLDDMSRRFENAGVRTHVVKAGRHKAVGFPGVAVSQEDLAVVQEEVDAVMVDFVQAVSQGRGIPLPRAQELGDGRIHLGARAVELGLADEIGTFQTAVQRAGELAAGVAPPSAANGGSMAPAAAAPAGVGGQPRGDGGSDEAPGAAALVPAGSSPPAAARTQAGLRVHVSGSPKVLCRLCGPAVRPGVHVRLPGPLPKPGA